MDRFSQFVKRYPLIIYFVLAYAFAWAFYPLIKISAVYGVPGLFAPALAAIIVSGIVGGRPRAGRLLRTLTTWRVNVIWYVTALGLPIVLTAIVALLSRFLGADSALEFAPITPLAAIVFVFVVGEEMGWRGFAQPQLEKRFSPLVAAVILGVIWGIWHLPNFFVLELPHAEIPIAAFVLYTVGFSVIAAWLLKSSRGSVLIATLFHGASNTFGFLTPSLETATRWWLLAGVYCAAALLVVTVYGVQLSRNSASANTPNLANALAKK
jgi:membrane protease YdiL (CAAX protease family)